MQDRSKSGAAVREVQFTENTSGWEAVDYKVIVKKDEVEEKTEGGILIPQDNREKEWWNVQTAVIVSKGHLAFTEGRDREGKLIRWDDEPQVGDRVMLREYVGMRFEGVDGERYAMINDKDVGGIRR